MANTEVQDQTAPEKLSWVPLTIVSIVAAGVVCYILIQCGVFATSSYAPRKVAKVAQQQAQAPVVETSTVTQSQLQRYTSSHTPAFSNPNFGSNRAYGSTLPTVSKPKVELVLQQNVVTSAVEEVSNKELSVDEEVHQVLEKHLAKADAEFKDVSASAENARKGIFDQRTKEAIGKHIAPEMLADGDWDRSQVINSVLKYDPKITKAPVLIHFGAATQRLDVLEQNQSVQTDNKELSEKLEALQKKLQEVDKKLGKTPTSQPVSKATPAADTDPLVSVMWADGATGNARFLHRIRQSSIRVNGNSLVCEELNKGVVQSVTMVVTTPMWQSLPYSAGIIPNYQVNCGTRNLTSVSALQFFMPMSGVGTSYYFNSGTYASPPAVMQGATTWTVK